MKLELYYPAKPFLVTQGWGIYNPAYERFGFNRHNGVDFLPGTKKLVYAPVRMRVYAVDFNEGAGNFVSGVTTQKWEVGGIECFVQLTFMHLEKALCKIGDILEIGDLIGVPDNTGFSTGPHTHMAPYRLTEALLKMDSNDANGSFDPSPYWNGYFAEDVNIMKQIISLLQRAVN